MSANLQTENFRRDMPPPLAERSLNLPEVVETTLDNGLRLGLIEDKRLPLVSFRLGFRSGDANDPPALPGLTDMMSHLLSEGTETRTSRQLAEEIERLGATLSVGSTSDFTTVAASSLSIYADEVLELVADVTIRSTFPENEVELARENTKQLLIQQRAQPGFLASERMAKVIYGSHAYATISPTDEMLNALTRDDLIAFRASTFVPNNAVLIVVGDFDHESLMTRVNELFAGWGSRAVDQPNSPALAPRNERVVYLVDRPGSAQSNIVIANEAITRTSPDYFPMLLMHTVLGANASSRLFMNLRERKGYTYGAYSNLDARRLAGTFRASAEVRTAVTGASLHEFFYELNRIRDEAVSAEEITNAKSYLTGVFPIRIETQDGLIDQLVNIKMFDLPDDYLRTYRDCVNAVTADEIQAVAQKYVTPDAAAIVIVGDAAEITEQIKPYSGRIEVYDTEGNRKK
ncbi:MAG TPA: pitrilysin family protein [Pyrinomonadaceae bacterium]|jgi:zinc protease|nr:pitrilysin family protein [Pyrinomonadaceae bacterium]